ncbi:MAG: hypothetical protein ACYDAE_17070 [Steroidobacteraceae bacterium]
MRTLTLVIALMLPIAAFADPPTAPEHLENDYKSIGGGLFLSIDADLKADEGGNTTVMVFSRRPIKPGGYYSFNVGVLDGYQTEEGTYDAGMLGLLYGQEVTIDCTHLTYEVIDARKVMPQPIWRTARTLSLLAPVFRYVCEP